MAERRRVRPLRALQALDRHRVTYIVIGGFARVIQGTEEMTRGIDIVPSTREENLRRLDAALHDLGARRADGQSSHSPTTPPTEPVLELTTDPASSRSSPSRRARAATTTSAAPRTVNRSARASAPRSPRSATSPAWSPPRREERSPRAAHDSCADSTAARTSRGARVIER